MKELESVTKAMMTLPDNTCISIPWLDIPYCSPSPLVTALPIVLPVLQFAFEQVFYSTYNSIHSEVTPLVGCNFQIAILSNPYAPGIDCITLPLKTNDASGVRISSEYESDDGCVPYLTPNDYYTLVQYVPIAWTMTVGTFPNAYDLYYLLNLLDNYDIVVFEVVQWRLYQTWNHTYSNIINGNDTISINKKRKLHVISNNQMSIHSKSTSACDNSNCCTDVTINMLIALSVNCVRFHYSTSMMEYIQHRANGIRFLIAFHKYRVSLLSCLYYYYTDKYDRVNIRDVIQLEGLVSSNDDCPWNTVIIKPYEHNRLHITLSTVHMNDNGHELCNSLDCCCYSLYEVYWLCELLQRMYCNGSAVIIVKKLYTSILYCLDTMSQSSQFDMNTYLTNFGYYDTVNGIEEQSFQLQQRVSSIRLNIRLHCRPKVQRYAYLRLLKKCMNRLRRLG